MTTPVSRVVMVSAIVCKYIYTFLKDVYCLFSTDCGDELLLFIYQMDFMCTVSISTTGANHFRVSSKHPHE